MRTLMVFKQVNGQTGFRKSMLNALQRTDGLKESRSPINNPQRQGPYFPFFFITRNARKIQRTETLLKLFEIILFTVS